ncbi:MAG: hypothetical protein K8R88_13050 [Armatimonadetes bacterium]|nr:hypothetical protein [Armatimonadota bacterium]
MTRNGQPYFIMGAGGTASRVQLAASGGNSTRTWGADNLEKDLAEAQKAGITVTAGIWLGHKDVFDYGNEALVAKQLQMCKDVVTKYKDHPSILMWAIGNEMDGYEAKTDPRIWKAINDICVAVKKIDPNHPTISVVAEVVGDRIEKMHELCPALDAIGINSYRGGTTIGDRYKKAGGKKPFVLTEFGPPGSWELEKTPWGAPIEPTSTEKAESYRASYMASVMGQKGLCLGSYAFLWGHKQEATATWFGMILPDGKHVGALDVMTELWTGKAPKNLCPKINSLKLVTANRVKPGEQVSAELSASDPEGDPIKVRWLLTGETAVYLTAGQDEPVPPAFPDALVSSTNSKATVKMPAAGGAYRLFAYVDDGKNGAAVANIPLYVDGPLAVQKGRPVKLPFAVYDEASNPPVFIASGWIGNTKAMALKLDSKSNPHSGSTCTEITFTGKDDWGGIIWQYPANDWGDLPDCMDLSGAKSLSFWLRGELGGEEVSVNFGLLGKDKKFPDSATGALANIKLTQGWTQHKINLAGKDLSKIKTAYGFTVATKQNAVKFFIDDVKYE